MTEFKSIKELEKASNYLKYRLRIRVIEDMSQEDFNVLKSLDKLYINKEAIIKLIKDKMNILRVEKPQNWSFFYDSLEELIKTLEGKK